MVEEGTINVVGYVNEWKTVQGDKTIRTPEELSLCYLLCAARAYGYNHLGSV